MKGATASLRRTVVVDGRPGPVRKVRAAVESFLEEQGLPADTVRAVLLAFAEALDNAVEHGTSGRGTIRVRLRYTPRFVLVSLRDAGGDQVPLPPAARPREPDLESERGRGLLLMNRLMDQVRVRSFPAGGTRVSMMRRLGTRA